MKVIYFVTSNKGKIETLKKYFQDTDIIIKNVSTNYEEPYVNNIEYIAKEKVLEGYKQLNKPCISLDAGFYIPSYPNKPNFPGAFPKRDLLDKIGINGLLEKMKDVKDRKCFFKECLAYYDGKDITYFYGVSEGTLSFEVKGMDSFKKWSDLWYVFVPKNESKTLAEMSEYERNTRKDGHTSALEEFSKWYKKIKVIEI